jgi:upstream activation factor subunit UAF30
MRQRFERLIKSKQELMNELKREVQELKKMQRDHEHALKEASKRSRKKRVRDENSTRKPSGFASPVVVSDELYSFLESFGVKKGDPIARTDVTRYVTTYIKDNDLQNPENRREIVPDTVLHKLFGPAMELKDPNDAKSPLVYTYLKLQRYLSQHFPKKASA